MNHPIVTIALFEFSENIRNKWIIVYSFSLFFFGYMILYFGGTNSLQAHASMLSLVLLIVPLFSLVYSSIALSESMPFLEMLAAQPISRRMIYTGKWLGLSIALATGMAVGISVLMLLMFGMENRSWVLMLMFLGVLLTFSFVSLSFLAVNYIVKKETLLGMILGLWFYFYLLYDVLILGVATIFGDYPLEIPMITMVILNPVDLVRILSILNMNIDNLMGYTGAVFGQFFGNVMGIVIGLSAFLGWIILPFYLGMRKFEKRDF